MYVFSFVSGVLQETVNDTHGLVSVRWPFFIYIRTPPSLVLIFSLCIGELSRWICLLHLRSCGALLMAGKKRSAEMELRGRACKLIREVHASHWCCILVFPLAVLGFAISCGKCVVLICRSVKVVAW